MPGAKPSLFPALAGAIGLIAYAGFLLGAESQKFVFGLLVAGTVAVYAAHRLRLLARFEEAAHAHQGGFAACLTVGLAGLCLYYRQDPFVLFLVVTVLTTMLACLGLNIQFGLAGVVNFAGASFFGIGGYVAAILTKTAFPAILILPLGGLAAALAGAILIVPVLKTRGHYAALVTIAFALLFKNFLDTVDALGGPQGLKVGPMKILGYSFAKDVSLFGFKGSFYLSYLALALVLTVLGFAVARRVENSFSGLSMDAVRCDETVSACFGLNIARLKIAAFSLGNFYCGLAGAFFAMALGYIAPTNFTFGDSLILLSIVILGGLGSNWGTLAATVIVILLPEKFQNLQEYRFLLYSTLVILILLFRPQGLIPRPMRDFSGFRGGSR